MEKFPSPAPCPTLPSIAISNRTPIRPCSPSSSFRSPFARSTRSSRENSPSTRPFAFFRATSSRRALTARFRTNTCGPSAVHAYVKSVGVEGFHLKDGEHGLHRDPHGSIPQLVRACRRPSISAQTQRKLSALARAHRTSSHLDERFAHRPQSPQRRFAHRHHRPAQNRLLRHPIRQNP